MAPAFNTDAYCQVGSRVPSPIASGSRATLTQSGKVRFADKPLVIRMPKDGCVQLRVACRKSNTVAHRNQ